MTRGGRANTRQHDEFQQAVVQYAELNGWHVWHDQDSRKNRAGLPDLLMLRGPRLIVAECKTGAGVTKDAQLDMLARFHQVGAEAVVWRPAGWPRAERWPIVETLDSPKMLSPTGVGDGGDFGAIGQRLVRVSEEADLAMSTNRYHLDLEPFLML